MARKFSSRVDRTPRPHTSANNHVKKMQRLGTVRRASPEDLHRIAGEAFSSSALDFESQEWRGVARIP